MNLTVLKEVDGTRTILHLEGILDITTTHLVNPYLEELDDTIQSLIFDFAGLEFMDSTGIGSIINAIHLANEKQFKIIFQEMNELTDQIFDMVGIYKILEAIQGEVV